MTLTRRAGGADSVPAGIIARPFARATVEMRFEPRAPVGVADQPALLPPDLAPGRTGACRAALATSSVSVAVTSGRNRWRPSHHLEHGRPEEHLEAHEHAHGVAGQAEVRLALDVAETLWHARLHRHLVEVDVAPPEERRLHDVALPHRDAAGGDERVGLDLEAEDRLAERLDVVAHDARHHGHRAHLAERAEDRAGVRVADLSERRRLGRRHELVARWRARPPGGAGARAASGWPAMARSPSSGAPRRFPAGTRTSPSRTSSPRGTDVRARRRAVEQPDERLALDVRVLDRHDRVGAGGDRARPSRCASPRRRRRSPRARGRSARVRRSSAHAAATGVAPATSEARTANPSIAEEANSGRSWVGDHVLGHHAAVRVRERQLERSERLDAGEDALLGLLDGQQPLAESRGRGRAAARPSRASLGGGPAGRPSAQLLAAGELGQERLELRADVVAIEGELDRRAQVVDLVPDVEPALEASGRTPPAPAPGG